MGYHADFIFTFLTIEFSESSGHSNALIIDFKNRRVIRFEPHGKHSTAYNQSLCDKNIKEAIQNHKLLSGFTYVGPKDYENVNGPQTIEANYQTKYKRVMKKFGSNERLAEAGGFCVAWATLFNHMVHLNETMPIKQVYTEHFTVDANQLADNIRIFQSYLVKLAKEYWGEKYKDQSLKP